MSSCAEHDRHKQNQHQRQSSGGSFEHAPNHHTPAATGQVLQHQQRQRAERDTDPEDDSRSGMNERTVRG